MQIWQQAFSDNIDALRITQADCVRTAHENSEDWMNWHTELAKRVTQNDN